MSIINNLLKKLNNSNLTPISGTDAAFLITESPNSPMHVGTLTVVEGTISFERFKNSLANKIHQLPKFRQKLVSVPFNLDFPYWVDDPNFNLDTHLRRIALPNPKDWNTLRELTSSIFSTPLDLRRPLWSIDFIEGLDGLSQVPLGSVGIVSKMHHVMVDGVSGMGIMGVLYDKKPNPEKNESVPPPYKPASIPDDLSILLKSYVGFVKEPLKLPKVLGQNFVRNIKNRVTKQVLPAQELPGSIYSVPRTIFNGNISPKRKWGTAILSFDRVKVLKNIMGVTLNDVVLAICAGALRKYLLEKNKLPKQSLVANIPVSIRAKEDTKNMNNQFSNMIVPIATDIEHPVERLIAINEYTLRGKEKHKALGAKTIAQMADAIPFGLANMAAGIYSRYNLTKLHKPIFNLTITNVPGPQTPLYLGGHKLHSLLGMGPLIDGQGLIIAILSYNGTITISPTSDAKTMPDINVFCRYLWESANELEAFILEGQQKKKVARKPVSDAFFHTLRKYLKDNPDSYKNLSGTFQFQITGQIPSEWQVNLDKGIVKKGKYKKPDVRLTVTDQHLNRIANLEIGVTEAKIQGRLKVEDFNNKFEELADLIIQMGYNKS